MHWPVTQCSYQQHFHKQHHTEISFEKHQKFRENKSDTRSCIVRAPPPFIKGVRILQNWWKQMGVWKLLLGKGGKAKWGGCHIILRFLWRFLMMQHGKKFWCVNLSFVNKHVLQNNCLNKIWDDWQCNNFNSVDICSSCINYSCK